MIKELTNCCFQLFLSLMEVLILEFYTHLTIAELEQFPNYVLEDES